MKITKNTSTKIEISCDALSFNYHNDVGTLVIRDSDTDNNTSVVIDIKIDELEYLLQRLKDELE